MKSVSGDLNSSNVTGEGLIICSLLCLVKFKERMN